MFCHIESNLGSDSLKGINQGLPPPEKCFFENPVHVFEVRDFHCTVAHLDSIFHIKSNLGSESLKGLNRVTPSENRFFENHVHVFEDKDF